MKTTWVDVRGQGFLVGSLIAENVRKLQGTGLLHGPLSQGEKTLCISSSWELRCMGFLGPVME